VTWDLVVRPPMAIEMLVERCGATAALFRIYSAFAAER
jgi:hypothetical protein